MARDAGELVDHTLVVIAVEGARLSGDGADRLDQLFGGVVLEHESAGAGAECFVDVFVESEGGEDSDPRGVVGGKDPAGGLEPVEFWHADVHQDHGTVKLRALATASIRCLLSATTSMLFFAGELLRKVTRP